MKQINGLLIGLIFTILAIGCQNAGNELPKEVSVKMDTVTFKLGDLSPGNSFSMQYMNWDKPQMAMFNKSLKTIDIYDLSSRSMSERIKLQSEGPDGVGSGNVGFTFISKDSIVIGNKISLYLLNRSGKVLKNYRLEIPELGGYPDFSIRTNKNVVKEGSAIYVSVYPQKNPFKKEHLKEWKNFVKVDLITGEMKAFGNFPDGMNDRIYGHNYVDKSYTRHGDDLIVSYYPMYNFYKISLNDLEKTEMITLENRSFEEEIPEIPNPDPKDYMGYSAHFYGNDSYNGVYFNGQYFLRICEKGVSEDDLKNMNWAKWKVIQLYNQNFDLVYEQDVNSKNWDFMMAMPVEDYFLIGIGSDVEDEMNFIKISVID